MAAMEASCNMSDISVIVIYLCTWLIMEETGST